MPKLSLAFLVRLSFRNFVSKLIITLKGGLHLVSNRKEVISFGGNAIQSKFLHPISGLTPPQIEAQKG